MSIITKIIVTSLVVLSIAGGVFLYSKKSDTPSPAGPVITASSPTVAHLTIEGIDGAMELKTFSWGGVKSTYGSGSLDFSMLAGKASPMLFQALASGTHFKTATLTSDGMGDSTVQDIVITSFKETAAAPDSPAVDQVTLLFAKSNITPPADSKIVSPPVTIPTSGGGTDTSSPTTPNCGSQGTLNSAGTCTCQFPTTWNGETCKYTAPVITCNPPRAVDSSGSCSCPQGKTWNGESCITPNPVCDPPMVWDGRSCVQPISTAPTCDQPRSLNSDGVCSCPSGLTWNGQACLAR